VYKYDDKYQFTESTWGTGINFANTPASFTATNFNKETIKDPVTGVPAYDANGNIQYLQRTNGAGTTVDKFTYNYFTNTNKLQNVVHDNNGTPQTYADYSYDARGQVVVEMTGDASKKKYIRYDVTGKVLAVARDINFTQKVVEYVYDEMGQRIIKRSYNNLYQLVQNTYYVGDVIYTQPVSGGTGGAIAVLEYEIDGGSGRLGVYDRPSNIYAYALTDHLGNTRAVVAKSGSSLEVRMYSDYYPFGMVIAQGGTSYRYGYQGQYAEKDGETDWNAFELRMYDARIARWLQYDPKGQYASPYIGMGNEPVSGVDPDGGWDYYATQNKDGSISVINDPGNHVGEFELMGQTYYNVLRSDAGGLGDWALSNANSFFGGYSYNQLMEFRGGDFLSKYSDAVNFNSSRMLNGGNMISQATGSISKANTSLYHNYIYTPLKSYSSTTRGSINMFFLEVAATELLPVSQAVRWVKCGGPTFAEARAAFWANRVKPVYDPLINRATGESFKIYEELHHAYVPQRWGLPKWITNSSWNLKPLNSLEHAIHDPYRYQFLPKWVKQSLPAGY